jgi:uncharacterized protein
MENRRMNKTFCLTWVGLAWLSGCGGDSSLGSGRDSESELSAEEDGPSLEPADETVSSDPTDSSDDDATNTTDEQDDEAPSSDPADSSDDDATNTTDDAGVDEPRLSSDDDTASSGGATSVADDDESEGSSVAGSANLGTGGGSSMVAVDGGASPQGTAGASPTGVAGMPNLEPADPTLLEPYEPRDGSFSMLAYSRTTGFRHTNSIAAGETMLQKIADQWGFDVVFTDTNEDFTTEGLSQFELVFFLNTTGDVLNEEEQAAYESWMTEQNGAFAGTHSATDTESGWPFYSEVTGQYHSGHVAAGTADEIQLEAALLEHPALDGLPNPWQRNEEWYTFDSHEVWSAKPGFTILGRKASDGQPVMWTREWGNFRAFYAALGHDSAVYGEADFEKHITGGILWAVRREHWLD